MQFLAESSQLCFEVLLIENSRGNPSLCWFGGGAGFSGEKIVNKHFVNKLAFPIPSTPKIFAIQKKSCEELIS